MDKMQIYELPQLLKNIFKKNKESWEQSRLVAYIIAQSNSTKQLKPTDIIRFSWENEDPDKNTSISQDDIQRLKEKSKQFLNLL